MVAMTAGQKKRDKNLSLSLLSASCALKRPFLDSLDKLLGSERLIPKKTGSLNGALSISILLDEGMKNFFVLSFRVLVRKSNDLSPTNVFRLGAINFRYPTLLGVDGGRTCSSDEFVGLKADFCFDFLLYVLITGRDVC